MGRLGCSVPQTLLDLVPEVAIQAGKILDLAGLLVGPLQAQRSRSTKLAEADRVSIRLSSKVERHKHERRRES